MPNDNKKDKKIAKTFDRDILQFKFLKEELELAESENNEGILDLLFRVNEFKNQLASEESESLSKKLDLPGYSSEGTKAPQPDQENNCTDNSVTKKRSSVGWQKKLLREIVKKTHPDKVINYTAEDREFYADICRKATECFNNSKDVELMLYGSEVRIKPQPITSQHLRLIQREIASSSKKINHLRREHGFVWYHLSDYEKETFLINYMAQLGYVIKKEEAVSVIKKSRPKRKTGTRPENLLKARRVKIKGNKV